MSAAKHTPRMPVLKRPPEGLTHEEACAFQAAQLRSIASVYRARGNDGKAARSESTARWWEAHAKAAGSAS